MENLFYLLVKETIKDHILEEQTGQGYLFPVILKLQYMEKVYMIIL